MPTITLATRAAVWIYVASYDASNQAGARMSSPVSVPVCSVCAGGEESYAGVFDAGTELVLTFSGVSCGESWLSTDTSHVQITNVSAGLWQLGYDDAGFGCNSSDHDYNDLIVDVTTTAYSPAESLGSGGELEHDSHPCAGDPVDCATGNFTETADDLSVPGRGIPLDLSRTYNSLAASTSSIFGAGWACSYCVRLTLDASSGDATITQGDGATTTFNSDGAGGFVAPAKVLGGLTANSDGTYSLTLPDRSTYLFSAAGSLLSQVDPNGYTTSLGYDGSDRLATITDPADRAVTLAYGNNGLVSTATDPAGNAVTYGYDTSGNLTTVTDPAGGITHYDYDSAHLLGKVTDPRNDGSIVNTYDSSGRVTKQVDAAGRTTTWSYGSNTTSITAPNGDMTFETYARGLLITLVKGYGTPGAVTWTYGYDQTLGVSSETDPNGHTWSTEFDLNGNPIQETDPLGNVTTSAYNSFNEPILVTDAANVTTTNQYDTYGNMTFTSTPLSGSSASRTTTLSYDPTRPGDMTSRTDPDGHTWTYTYDKHGDLSSSTDAANDTTSYTYNSVGWKLTMVTPRGNLAGANSAAFTWTYGHDSDGRTTTITDPNGHTATMTYDGDGNIATETDAAGNKTTKTYDPDNEMTSVDRADGTSLQYAYDGDGNKIAYTDGSGDTTTYNFSNPTLPTTLTSTTDAQGRQTSYSYDGAGNLTAIQQPGGDCSANPLTGCIVEKYNADNQRTAITYSDGTTPSVTFGYDVDGRRTTMTDGTGTTTYSYDSLGRLIGTTDGAGSSVGYGYDLAGNMTSIVYPNGRTVTHGYDAANRLHTVTDWNSKTTTFNDDADSNQQSEVYPNGVTATYGYDNADQLTSISDASATNPSSPILSFGYHRDPNDRISSVSSAGVPTDDHSYTYDKIGRVSGVDQSTYGYDNADNLTQQPDGAQQVNDSAGEITASGNTSISLVGTVGAGNTNTSSLTLTLPVGTAAKDTVLLATTLDNNKTVTTPAGYTVVGTFTSGTANGSAKMVVFTRTVAAGDASVTLSYPNKFAKSATLAVYRGLAGGNPIEMLSPGSASPGTSVTDTSLTTIGTGDRLVMMTAADGSAGTWAPPNGMTSRAQQTGGTTDSAISDQVLTSAGASGSRTATHTTSAQLVGLLLALRPSQTSYGYDRRGNRTSATSSSGVTTAMNYDQANRLINYGSTVNYSYDGNGLRSSKSVSGTATSYTWDVADGTPLLLTDGSTNYIYGPNGMPVEQIGSTGTSYFLQDQLGSTRALTNDTGTVVATYTYNAYGALTSHTGTVDTALRWTGQYQDAETGLYYLRARYFDPTTSQFISIDPVARSTQQPYQYAYGDPLDTTDPRGLCGTLGWIDGDCEVRAAVGGIATASKATYNTVLKPVGHFVAHHYGTIISLVGAATCIVVSAGTCVVLIAAGTAAELAQQYTNGTLTARSASETILLGLVAVGTAGTSRLLEATAEPAVTAGGTALTDTAIYAGTMYGLNSIAGVASAIPAIPELEDACP